MPDTGAISPRLIELRRRWEDEPGSPIFLQLAEEYRRVGRASEALEVLETGLEKSPGYVSARVALGRILLELGRPADSLVQLKSVLERDPTHLVASKLMVEAHLQRHDPVLARRQLDHYSQLAPTDTDLEALRTRIDHELLAPAEEVPLAALPEPPPVSTPPAPRPVWRSADAPEPFARPGGLDRPAYRDLLASEGLFSAPAPAPEPAPEATSEAARETPPETPPETPIDQPVGDFLDDDTAVLPNPEPVLAAPAPEPATVTLADLYLRQGHLEEAGRIYLRVLDRDPDNPQALAGLKEVADQLAPSAPEPDEPTAVELSVPPASLHERKLALYRRYLDQLKALRSAHAP